MVVGWRPDRGAVPSLGRAGVPLCFGAWVARPPSFAERAGCCMVALAHHVFTASAPLTTLLPPGARWGWHTGWTTPTCPRQSLLRLLRPQRRERGRVPGAFLGPRCPVPPGSEERQGSCSVSMRSDSSPSSAPGNWHPILHLQEG